MVRDCYFVFFMDKLLLFLTLLLSECVTVTCFSIYVGKCYSILQIGVNVTLCIGNYSTVFLFVLVQCYLNFKVRITVTLCINNCYFYLCYC